MRTVLNSSGEASRKALLISTNVEPQTRVTRISRMWALSERDTPVKVADRLVEIAVSKGSLWLPWFWGSS